MWFEYYTLICQWLSKESGGDSFCCRWKYLGNQYNWEEMWENRQALNKIIGSLATLNVKLGNIIQALEKRLFQVGQFVQLYLQLYSIIKE